MSDISEKAEMNINRDSLGQRLKKLRKLRHMSQETVAGKLGIMRCTYYHYESGRTVPPAKILYALASLYDVSPEILLYPDGETDGSGTNPAVAVSQFTDRELELVYYYRKMDDRAKDDILLFAKMKGEE